MIMDIENIAYSDLEGFGLRGMGMCLKSRTEEKPMQASSAAVRTRAIICCGCSLAHLGANSGSRKLGLPKTLLSNGLHQDEGFVGKGRLPPILLESSPPYPESPARPQSPLLLLEQSDSGLEAKFFLQSLLPAPARGVLLCRGVVFRLCSPSSATGCLRRTPPKPGCSHSR